MEHLIFLAFVCAAGAAFAALEVQIEGDAGWAASLPTWRRDNRWTRMLMGGRELTGYHVWCHTFVLIMAHLPFALAITPFSLRLEARIAAFIILFWIIEDFLWFVINPRYGVRGFTADRAAWHRSAWWGIMPREYWVFLPIGLLLYGWSVTAG